MVVYFIGKGVGLGMEQRIIDEVKFVDGYEGLYLIDNLGNVISVPKIEGRYIRNKYNILATKVNKYGYVEVTLVKDSKMKTHLLHRLIAKAFVPNPNNYDVVNHKNGINNLCGRKKADRRKRRYVVVHCFFYGFCGSLL